jgi:hypothetical protein
MTSNNVNILKVKSSDTQEKYEIRDKNSVLYFVVNCIGSQKQSFYRKEELEFSPEKIEITKIKTGQSLSLNNEVISYDLEDIFYHLDIENNYHNMSGKDVKKFIDIWGFEESSYLDIKRTSHDCDCCGFYENHSFEIKNQKGSFSFEDDGHFGGGYLPSPYDLFNFIMNGQCQTEYPEED